MKEGKVGGFGHVFIDCGGPCSIGDALASGFYLAWTAFLVWIIRDSIIRLFGGK
jgi:hypothetical protein